MRMLQSLRGLYENVTKFEGLYENITKFEGVV